MSSSGKRSGVVAENRQARRDYEIEETLEVGIVLQGSEVKSLRAGHVNIAEAYARFDDEELWLINANIPAYKNANRFNHEPKRHRKLLTRLKERSKLIKAIERQGRTIVPLKLYFSDRGIAKLLIGVATGRKNLDKRQLEAKRDWNRQQERLLKSRP